MEYILSSKTNLCLSWDATTIDGQHVNEIHITANRNECLMLDVRNLPGGKTADYVLHIVNALTDAAEVFSKFTGESFQELTAKLKTAK